LSVVEDRIHGWWQQVHRRIQKRRALVKSNNGILQVGRSPANGAMLRRSVECGEPSAASRVCNERSDKTRRTGLGSRLAEARVSREKLLTTPTTGAIRAASPGARTTARRFRAHLRRRAPGRGGSDGEPRNAAEVDARGGAVARAAQAAPGRARVARAVRPLRRTGSPGQLALSLAGRP
jgi:hypothetical protein